MTLVAAIPKSSPFIYNLIAPSLVFLMPMRSPTSNLPRLGQKFNLRTEDPFLLTSEPLTHQVSADSIPDKVAGRLTAG